MARSWFGPQPRLTLGDDSVWRSRADKLRGLAALAAAADPAHPRLLLAHFPATYAALAAVLAEAGVAHLAVADGFELDALVAGLRPTHDPARRPVLALAGALPEAARLAALVGGGPAAGLSGQVLAAERHPLRAHDEALAARLGGLPYPARLSFHLALDDPLLARFGGEAVGALMDRLAVPPDAPLSQGLLSRSVQQAQAKLAQAARGDGPAHSPETWFVAYVPA